MHLVCNRIRNGLCGRDLDLIFLIFSLDCFLFGINPSIFLSARYDKLI